MRWSFEQPTFRVLLYLLIVIRYNKVCVLTNNNKKGKYMRGLIHHIELYVNDLNKSKEFWGWLLEKLNYHEYQKWEEGISYKNGESYIVFVQVESRFIQNTYHRCHHGLNHLAFYGDDQQFVDEITLELKAKGVTILYEDQHPYAGGEDYYAVYFEDPDRMKVEIVANPK